jgi:OmpA-OmpF porin, OOP family
MTSGFQVRAGRAAAGVMLITACGAKEVAPPSSESTRVPAVATSATADTSLTFDVTTVPLATAPLPEFPYVEWPEFVSSDARHVERQASVDALTVIAGAQLVTVEGRLEQRLFSIPAGRTPLELRRHYRDRITALGGQQVNRLQPVNDAAVVVDTVRRLFPAEADPAKRLDLQRYDEGQYQYEVYLVRTAETHAWIVVQSSTYSMVVTTIAANAK